MRRHNSNKNFQTIISKIVKKYFAGKFSDDLDVFDTVTTELQNFTLSDKELSKLKKILKIFLLGQIVGLPSLTCILTRFTATKSTQSTYNKICKNLLNSDLHNMFEYVFEQQLTEVLQGFCDKHPCKFSRDLMTAVLDDSVFKQWLQNSDNQNSYEDCYGRFFSGQVGHVTYGFQVVTFGLTINGVFYPLYFESVKKIKKEDQNDQKGKQTIKVAQNIIKKWGQFVQKLKQQNIELPVIHFSCDSGYSDVLLSTDCLDNGLCYISVPGKKHIFNIDGLEQNLNFYIENTFIPLEKVYNEQQIDGKYDKNIAFTNRFRAFYKSQNREVTLLAFRLNGSKKVSIIYSTDKDIKAKTLRRHWFQRTYIEQFFKILKHTMLIQKSITTSKHDFELKLLRFAFVALHLQLLVKFMRKKQPDFKRLGFGTIRMFMQSEPEILQLLENII
jgi:hypothetical protein